jgi:CheY-like chemotaxis protein
MSMHLTLTSERRNLTPFLVDMKGVCADHGTMLNNQDGMARSDGEAVGLGTILILEDEVLVSIVMEEVVRELGASRVVVIADTASALALVAESPPDIAILDVHLGSGTSFLVADALEERGVPFMFSSALGAGSIEERHRHRPMLSKPFADDELRAQLLGLATR